MRPVAVVVVLALVAPVARAAIVPVRTLETTSYGVVSVRGVKGDHVADGEMIQRIQGGNVESRLRFLFDDGSRYDELVVFSQDRVFRLLSYSLTQTGPAFRSEQEVSFDRKTGRYRARTREAGKQPETSEGTVEIPDDVYNGMIGVVIRNTDGRAIGHSLAFTPKPRLLDLTTVPADEADFWIGKSRRLARRHVVQLRLGGLTGLAAGLAGKQPDDVSFWFSDAAPAFLKFEGALYVGGPVWTVEPTSPRWTRTARR